MGRFLPVSRLTRHRLSRAAMIGAIVGAGLLARQASEPTQAQINLPNSPNYELNWGEFGDDGDQFHLPRGLDVSSTVRHIEGFSTGVLPLGWSKSACVDSVLNIWNVQTILPPLALTAAARPDPELSPEPTFLIPPALWYSNVPLHDPQPDTPQTGPLPPCDRLVGTKYPPKHPPGDLCTGPGLIPSCGNVVSTMINLFDIPTPITLTFTNLLDKLPGIHIARLEISVNGSEWAVLKDYTAIAATGQGTRSGIPPTYPKEELDLSDFSNSIIQLRWFFHDALPFESTNYFGWIVDNVEIRGGLGTRRPLEGGGNPPGAPPGPQLPPIPDPSHMDFRCPAPSLPSGARAPLEEHRIYVADTGNHRISVFSYMADGPLEPVRCTLFGSVPPRNWFGEFGDAGDQFNSPEDVVVGPDGYIYVADTGNHRILRFKTAGGPATIIGLHGGGALNAYGQYGDGRGLDGTPNFNSPKGLAAGPWNLRKLGFSFTADHFYLYVADTGNHRVQRLAINKRGGLVNTEWREWGAYGDDSDEFHLPSGIDVNPIDTPLAFGPPLLQLPAIPKTWAGRVYVADTGNHRIQVTDFDGDFKLLEDFGEYGDDSTEMNSPDDIAVGVRLNFQGSDRLVDIYPLDTGNHRVQLWRLGFVGNIPSHTRNFSRYGDNNGQLNSPRGIAVDRLKPETYPMSIGVEGDVFTMDTGNHRGQRYDRPDFP